MAREKRRKAAKAKNKQTYEFSLAHEYNLSSFGRPNELVNMYALNIAVGALLQDFKVFEDLNNVQSWPISTLIQRELDHKRASLICKDYLLKGGDTKYFPPLIAVLIPTDEEYKPLDGFTAIQNEEINAVKTKFVKGNEDYRDYDKLEAITGGITKIPYGEVAGDLVWDKNTVSAVIIDGQHRYKALQEAKESDKSFDDCLLTITLIDLSALCEDSNKTPTAVARDLFVTINNTPVEVDETRLVLMDDKDVLATFTQVLIDDSLETRAPAIPPELIDWECEGAKHNSSNSLSGVLVLRQIILSAMFDDARVSTVDDRTNVRKVRKWKERIEDWLSPDVEIEQKFGSEETIRHRFKIAEEEIKDNQDDEEEDSIFLFSYSTVVAQLLKDRFLKLVLSSFREVFSKLVPYERLSMLALEHGVLEKGKPLNNYFRAFKGKRDSLRNNNPDIKKAVSVYEKEFSRITEKLIPYTVMGQKAIFKALFDGFLSGVEKKEEKNFLDLTKDFINSFNDVYERLCPSLNSDENFFLTDFKMARNRIQKAKSVGGEFWKGIVIKYNGEIDYSKSSILVLSQVLQDLIFFSREDCETGEDMPEKVFKFKEHSKLVQRHMRLIAKLEFEEELSDEKMQELAENVVQAKEKEVQRLFAK